MARTSLSAPAPARLRVAIVDDHQLLLDGLSARLAKSRSGIDVAVMTTTWRGLLASEAFPTDIVVLDLNLEDDIPIGVKIRAISAAGAKTIVISRHADTASIRGAIRAGAIAFVPKSESAAELLEAIRAAAVDRQRHSPIVQRALTDGATDVDPGLGRQEMRALVLYAAGRSIRQVAEDMETTQETVKSYIKRARRKYLAVGVDLGSKLLLRRHAVRQGWITPE